MMEFLINLVGVGFSIYFIIKIIKEYKNENSKNRSIYHILFFIFSFPFLVLLLDLSNVTVIENSFLTDLTKNYDWLSFIGAYSGAIVSALLLLIITRNDRDENTEILRMSQRPYLTIQSKITDSYNLKTNSENIIIFSQEEDPRLHHKENIYVIEIENVGETVAILNIDDCTFKVKSIKEEVVKFKKYLNVLSIPKSKKVSIVLYEESYYIEEKLDNDFSVISISLNFKDLFDTFYEIEQIYEKDKLLVKKNNSIINEQLRK